MVGAQHLRVPVPLLYPDLGHRELNRECKDRTEAMRTKRAKPIQPRSSRMKIQPRSRRQAGAGGLQSPYLGTQGHLEGQAKTSHWKTHSTI